MKDAACRRPGVDPELFFPEGEKAIRDRAWLPLCDSCPVRQLCYDGAVERKERVGVWGGFYFTAHGTPGRIFEGVRIGPRKRKSRARLTPEQRRAANARPRGIDGRMVKAGG